MKNQLKLPKMKLIKLSFNEEELNSKFFYNDLNKHKRI